MKRLISAVFCVLISSQVIAETTVTRVRVDSDGKGMITIQVNNLLTSSCRTPGYGNNLAFNANTVGGKNILAWALTAKATGALVDVAGTGTCTIYNYVDSNNVEIRVEDLAYGILN